MPDLQEAFRTAFGLVVSFDPQLMEIIVLSLKVTLTAVAIATLIGLALGGILAVYRFPGRGRASGHLSMP